MVASAAVFPLAESANAASATTTANLNLRSGASLNHSVLTVMPAGSAVTINGDTQNGFYPVSYNGTSGWAHSSYLSTGGNTASPASADSATTTAYLNLRAGASLGDRVLTVMPYGASVTVTGGAVNGFYPLTYNGTSGWAHGDYLSLGSSGSTHGASTGSATTTAYLNMRSGSSLGHAVLTVIPYGARVTLNGSSERGFFPVTYNGMTGWAHEDYLTTGGGNTGAQASSGASQSQQDIINIIYAAADRYGQPREDMLRVARCESNLDPSAVGAGSLGLFQFLRGTWATTPYADQDIFDAEANANAAAWMWSEGRRNEWVCQ